MPNIARMLKDEILRLARKELRSSVKTVKADCMALKAQVRDLRAQVAALEKSAAAKPGSVAAVASVPVKGQTPASMRFSSKTLRALRHRLGVSQKEMGKLVGLSAQAVYLWECKGGDLRLRNDTRQALLKLKAMGRREVAKLLVETADQ